MVVMLCDAIKLIENGVFVYAIEKLIINSHEIYPSKPTAIELIKGDLLDRNPVISPAIIISTNLYCIKGTIKLNVLSLTPKLAITPTVNGNRKTMIIKDMYPIVIVRFSKY